MDGGRFSYSHHLAPFPTVCLLFLCYCRVPLHAVVASFCFTSFLGLRLMRPENQGQRSSCLMVLCSSWVPRPIHRIITPWSKPLQLLGNVYQSPSVECYPTRLILGIWLDRVQAMLRWIGQLSWFLPVTDAFHNFCDFCPLCFQWVKKCNEEFTDRSSFHKEGVGKDHASSDS